VIGWVLAVARVATGVLVLLLPQTHGHGGYVMGAVAFVAAVAAGQFARCGVYVLSGDVRVRNMLRTTELAWEQVKEFKLSQFGACQIALTDGRWVSIIGTEQTNLEGMKRRQNTPARRMIADLNRLLREDAGTR
jgi:hypothetical protein